MCIYIYMHAFVHVSKYTGGMGDINSIVFPLDPIMTRSPSVRRQSHYSGWFVGIRVNYCLCHNPQYMT